MAGNVALELRNISKSFPGVKALDNVSFTVNEGEVHVLVGENGAGKSGKSGGIKRRPVFETGLSPGTESP